MFRYSIPGGDIEHPHLLHRQRGVVPHGVQFAEVLLVDVARQILAADNVQPKKCARSNGTVVTSGTGVRGRKARGGQVKTAITKASGDM